MRYIVDLPHVKDLLAHQSLHREFMTICAMQFGRYGRLRSVWVARKVKLAVRSAANASGHYSESLLTLLQLYGAASRIR